VLTGRAEYRQAAQGVARLLRQAMERYPLGFARSLDALDFLLSEPAEVVVVGPPGASDTEALRRATFEPFVPNKVVAGPGADIPLLEGRDQPTQTALAYVCRHYVCLAPTRDPGELRRQLAANP
jgi:uncharacterized protein YyaL (SSP411 family)